MPAALTLTFAWTEALPAAATVDNELDDLVESRAIATLPVMLV